MIEAEGLRGIDLQLGGEALDTLPHAPLRPAAVFPTDWRELFSRGNPYEAAAIGAVPRREAPGCGRVFAGGGRMSRYAVRGGYTLQGEVAIPRPAPAMSTVVGVSTLGILLLFLVLFMLFRRQYVAYSHRYMNSRFFGVQSVRTTEMAVPLSAGFRVCSDIAWSLLVGFLVWRGLWLQWYLRARDEETLLGMLGCMVSVLLFLVVRYVVLELAERLSEGREWRRALWENAQVPMRAMWPLLLVGAVLSVYTAQAFQWYALVVTLCVVGVGWALRIYRMVITFRWHGYGWLYFFLYLCGVEILLPLLAVRIATLYLLVD